MKSALGSLCWHILSPSPTKGEGEKPSCWQPADFDGWPCPPTEEEPVCLSYPYNLVNPADVPAEV
jgi:hypothetical protein